MENQEIDATKANIVFDEETALNILSSAISSDYDRDKLFSDIKSGVLKSSDVLADPSVLQKYLLKQND